MLENNNVITFEQVIAIRIKNGTKRLGLENLLVVRTQEADEIETFRYMMGSLHQSYPEVKALSIGDTNAVSELIFQELELFENSFVKHVGYLQLYCVKQQMAQLDSIVSGQPVSIIPSYDDLLNAKCSLQYKWTNPPYIPPRDSEKKKFCMCIPVYGGEDLYMPMESFSFFSVVLKSFLETTASNSKFDWVFYVAFQPDPFFEDAEFQFREVFQAVLLEHNRNDVELKEFFYPLNSGLLDITYKYNRLIDQAYRDQCNFLPMQPKSNNFFFF